jgi:hypothetical protein
MPLTLGDRILDFGLTALNTDCDRIYICSSQPTTYVEATDIAQFALGYRAFGVGNAFAVPVAGSPSGRKAMSTVITDGDVIDTGTAAFWAAVDSVNTRLLASGNINNTIAVVNGQKFTLASFAVHLPSETEMT